MSDTLGGSLTEVERLGRVGTGHKTIKCDFDLKNERSEEKSRATFFDRMGQADTLRVLFWP